MPRNFVSLFGSGGDVLPVAGGGADVAFDNSSNTLEADNNATAVGTLTVGSLSNGILIAFIATEDAAAGAAVVSGVNSSLGGAFTHLGSSAFNFTVGGVSDYNGDIWYLLNPAAGSHTVTATMNEATNETNVGLASFANVSQSAPFGTPVTHTDITEVVNNYDTTVSSAAGDMMLAGFLSDGQSLAEQDTTAPATKMWENFDGSGPLGNVSMAAYRACTGGSTTINFTLGRSFGTVGVALKKA